MVSKVPGWALVGTIVLSIYLLYILHSIFSLPFCVVPVYSQAEEGGRLSQAWPIQVQHSLMCSELHQGDTWPNPTQSEWISAPGMQIQRCYFLHEVWTWEIYLQELLAPSGDMRDKPIWEETSTVEGTLRMKGTPSDGVIWALGSNLELLGSRSQ